MLNELQEQLEHIYGLRSEHRAADFLIGAESAKELGCQVRAREELLVLEADDSLDLALYVEPALLERVSRYETPSAALKGDLGEFCEVAEGVSHFVYLTHTARAERTVSLLELEAQAEVDKFALCTLLRWSEGARGWASSLIAKLFDAVSFHEHLTAPERWRYSEANRLAKRYTQRLMKFVTTRSAESLISELRHAYRLGAEAKLAYFAR